MSAAVIACGTSHGTCSFAIWLGASGGSRLSRTFAFAPPCHSSTPASAPCACTASVISRSAATSPSSHSRAETYGSSSEVGEIEQYSVQTAPQPPSAFMPRCAACVCGFVTPKPGAVRHLVEAVRQRHRADRDRLEEDVVAGVPHASSTAFRRAMNSCSSSSTAASMPGSS